MVYQAFATAALGLFLLIRNRERPPSCCCRPPDPAETCCIGGGWRCLSGNLISSATCGPLLPHHHGRVSMLACDPLGLPRHTP